MKRIVIALIVLALASPLAAETWKSVALMDAGCASNEEKVAHPEAHKTSCAIRCAKSGYGVIVDGKWIKFDEKGNELALKALKETKQTEKLVATVTGELKDGTITVESLSLDE